MRPAPAISLHDSYAPPWRMMMPLLSPGGLSFIRSGPDAIYCTASAPDKSPRQSPHAGVTGPRPSPRASRPGAELDAVGERAEEGGAADAVDQPTIDGEGEVHAAGDGRRPAAGDHALMLAADGQDARLARMDDGLETIDAAAPEVGQRDRSGGRIRGDQPAGAHPLDRVAPGASDLGQRAPAEIGEDRDHHPALDRDHEADVDGGRRDRLRP